MFTRTRILAHLILLATTTVIELSSGFFGVADDQRAKTFTETTTSKPTIDEPGIYGADDATEQQIHAIIDRFADASMDLPEIRIYVHDTQEPCNDNMGLYSKGGDQYRIDVCETYDAVITHELVHVWEYHTMTDATRQMFLDRIGFGTWNDGDTPHRSRGVEQVAYLVTWGLEADPIQAMTLNHHREDLDLFELLTGTTSPRIDHLDTSTDNPTPAPVRLTIDLTDIVSDPNFQ